MPGSSKEEIARQHAEALELMKWQPLETGAPAQVGKPIPLANKIVPVIERIVVKDISSVTGPAFVEYVKQLQLFTAPPSQPHKENSNDENEEISNMNSLEKDPLDGEDAIKGNNMESSGLMPVEALAPYWSYRGQVDAEPLRKLLVRGYNVTPTPLSPKTKYLAKDILDPNNYWDTVHAAVKNVTIHRPSHDQWGIPKIVLVFCDDFIDRVFELPWWTREDSPFRQAIQPILDILDVSRKQIVRLLLASLPPETTIPIHFDSGEWVRSTHRVHVPVLLNNADAILFRCGPTLERIPTRPGYVFEINNQSWHAVSNCDTDHRVHLILDYIDDAESNPLPRQRIQLEPGETLRQTRRSVDRAIDAGKRPTPSFLILGAQKAGTTSLYEALMQHPWLVRPVKFRETHCLDWRWNDELTTLEAQQKQVGSFFHTETLRHYPSCQTGDSTPSYLIDAARVIPRLLRVWPHWREMKFMVMLREPIQRCESHFAMATSPIGTPAQLKARGSEWRESTLEQVLENDLQLLQSSGVIPYWQNEKVDRKIYDKFINTEEEYQAWQRYLSHIPSRSGSYALIGRSMYALNLLPWLRTMERSQFFVICLEDWSKDPQAILSKLWQHIDLPHCSSVDAEPQNTRVYESKLSPEWRQRLELFFEPHNERLVDLLACEENPWSRRWIYGEAAAN